MNLTRKGNHERKGERKKSKRPRERIQVWYPDLSDKWGSRMKTKDEKDREGEPGGGGGSIKTEGAQYLDFFCVGEISSRRS